MLKGKFIRNLSFVFFSNILNLIVSLILVALIPKKIGIDDYGYWQIYLLYASYAGILLLGWNDGIYLRYAGVNYLNLSKSRFFSQILSAFIMQLILCIIINFFITMFIDSYNSIIAFRLISISFLLTNSSGIPLSILQGTNRLIDFSKANIYSKTLFFILIIAYFLSDSKSFIILIILDLVSKVFMLVYALYLCKELFDIKIIDIKFEKDEIVLNILAGIKLMFSNIASMLIIGIIRIGIEKTWDISTFAQVSMTLSISSLLMIFVNAIGIVIFPILRKISRDKIANIYVKLRYLLVVILFSMLLMFYPLKIILTIWLPKYSQSLVYMGLTFPILIYEGKMALLINTFLKVLREESQLLKINIFSMIISIVLVIICASILRNLVYTILSIVITLFFRSIISEQYIDRVLNIKEAKHNILETFLVFIFIFSNIKFNTWISFLLYTSFFFIFILIKLKDLKISLYYLIQIYKTSIS